MKKEVLIREVLWSLSRRRKSKTRLFHMDEDVDRDQQADDDDDDDDSSSLSWHCQEHLRAKEVAKRGVLFVSRVETDSRCECVDDDARGRREEE